MDLQKSHLSKRMETFNIDEEDEGDSIKEKEERRERETQVIRCLIQPFINTADESLKDNRLDQLLLPVYVH